jgi:hypothetical protein
MAYNVTTTTIIPAGAPEFDEWFDSIPVDYFTDTAGANGKNKFELLEECLAPPTERQIGNAISVTLPTFTTTRSKNVNQAGDIVYTAANTWDSELDYRTYDLLATTVFTDQEYLDWSLSTLQYQDIRDPVLFPSDQNVTIGSDGEMILSDSAKNAVNSVLPDNLKRQTHPSKAMYSKYVDQNVNFITKQYNEIFNISVTTTFG